MPKIVTGVDDLEFAKENFSEPLIFNGVIP
jgi:hypothetical protein